MYSGAIPLRGSQKSNRLSNSTMLSQQDLNNVNGGSAIGNNWTLWTVRDPFLTDIFGSSTLEALNENDTGPLRIRMSRRDLAQVIGGVMASVCSAFPGLQEDFLAVHPKDLGLEYLPCLTEKLLLGKTFSYSSYSRRLELDVQEILFQGGKATHKTDPGRIKLKAHGGLAEILTACITGQDVFIVSGTAAAQKLPEDEFRELSLNESDVWGLENSEKEHVLILRICFDVKLSLDVHLFERVRPWKDQYEFKYVSVRKKLKTEMTQFREFSLAFGPYKLSLDGPFPMPITREGSPTEAYDILISQTSLKGSPGRKSLSPAPAAPKASSSRQRYSGSPSKYEQSSSTWPYSTIEPGMGSLEEQEESFHSTASSLSAYRKRSSFRYSADFEDFVNGGACCEGRGRFAEIILVFILSFGLILIAYYVLTNVFQSGEAGAYGGNDAPCPCPQQEISHPAFTIPPVDYLDDF